MQQKLKLDSRRYKRLSRELMINYGPRLLIAEATKRNNKVELLIDYRRILHLLDSDTNTVYVRALHFPAIFGIELKDENKLKIPLDEINNNINNRYSELRSEITRGILTNKKIILKVIKGIPLFTAFLNKFNELVSSLVQDGKIPKASIQDRIQLNSNYKKYIDTIISSKYASYDKNHNLKASKKIIVPQKDMVETNKATIKDVIDEILYIIIKDNFDYIVHHLKIYILRAYVNILSCLNYVTFKNGIKKISMNSNDLMDIYDILYGDIKTPIFQQRLRYLVNAGIIDKGEDTISWSAFG